MAINGQVMTEAMRDSLHNNIVFCKNCEHRFYDANTGVWLCNEGLGVVADEDFCSKGVRPKHMTWRDLLDELTAIKEHAACLLDMRVMIDDHIHGSFYGVSVLSPYDDDAPASFTNPLSLTISNETF